MNFAFAEQALLSKVLDHGKAEGEGLARAGEVSGNHIFAIEDRVEAVLLNREETLDALCTQLISSAASDFWEALKARVRGDCVLLAARVSLL